MKHRLVFLPLFFAALGFFAFLRMPGAENVRAVQVVSLIGTGMCIGVALARLLIRQGVQPRA
jgi:hypothetical protein